MPDGAKATEAKDFHGKQALVTGTTKGTGRQIVQRLIRRRGKHRRTAAKAVEAGCAGWRACVASIQRDCR